MMPECHQLFFFIKLCYRNSVKKRLKVLRKKNNDENKNKEEGGKKKLYCIVHSFV